MFEGGVFLYSSPTTWHFLLPASNCKKEYLAWLLLLRLTLCMRHIAPLHMGIIKDSAHSQSQIRKSSIAELQGILDRYFPRGLCLHVSFQRLNLLNMSLITSAMAGGPMIASLRACPLPVVLGIALIVFMKLEYTVHMVMPGMEPRDLGFLYTTWVHRFLANHPLFNSIFAACNTAFVVFQMAYVLWTLFVDRRKRPAIAFLFMYTLRAFLGYATQLPVPQDFLGSGLDFPVNNTSFFLFFSGHVAGSVIVSMDMRRTHRYECGSIVGYLNFLQSLRLLATRGHYTIDLAIGAGAGWACDLLAGKYEEIQEEVKDSLEGNGATNGSCTKQ